VHPFVELTVVCARRSHPSRMPRFEHKAIIVVREPNNRCSPGRRVDNAKLRGAATCGHGLYKTALVHVATVVSAPMPSASVRTAVIVNRRTAHLRSANFRSCTVLQRSQPTAHRVTSAINGTFPNSRIAALRALQAAPRATRSATAMRDGSRVPRTKSALRPMFA